MASSISYSVLPTSYLNLQNMPSPMQLGYHSNNLYDNFPPLMSDGRTVIASWQPDAVANEQLLKDNNIKTNWEYRRYLQNNANSIMQQNNMSMSNDVGYVRRYDAEPSIRNVPHNFTNTNQHRNIPGYSDSDLKRLYLSREELNAKTMSATQPITQAEVMKYK